MQTVLVPTDFNISSLDCVSAICKRFKEDDLSFIFVHMFKLSDSISDLLMLAKRSREFELISDDFYTQCNHIKGTCPQVKFLRVEFLYGSTLAMFRNFIEANKVDYILNVGDCSVGKLNKASINPSVLIQRCGLPVISLEKEAEIVEMRVNTHMPEPEMSEA